MACNVSIHTIESAQKALLSHIEQHPYIQSLRVVHSSPVEIPSSSWWSSSWLTSDQLMGLLETPGFVYIQSSPSDSPVSDTLVFQNKTLHLTLSQASYQCCPDLNVPARKLLHSKVGHGSKNHAAYSYSLTIDLVHSIPASLKYALTTVFPKAHFDVCANTDLSSILPSSTINTPLTSTTLNPNIDLSPLCTPILDIESSPNTWLDLYEYLTLLTLNSPSLVPDHVDPYISSFTVPTQPLSSDATPAPPTTPLHVSHAQHLHSQILAALFESNWSLISVRSPQTHSMWFRHNNTIVLWESHKELTK